MTESLDHHLEHFDPTDPDTVRDFWPAINHIRDTCPVAHSDALGGFWLLTRYADVAPAAQDWQTFTSSRGQVFPRHPDMELMDLIEQDPPLHREWRRLFNPLFTPAKVAGLAPVMREVTTQLIDEFIEDGEVDISARFAHVLPGTIFFRVAFGITDQDLHEVHDWLIDTIQRIGPASAEAHDNLVAWLKGLLTERRDSGQRRDDILDAVLHAQIGGRQRTVDELVPILMLLTIGGLDTIQNATGNIVLRLCQQPEIADWLRENPARIPRAIHEFLRIDPPVMLTRVATRDVEVDGHLIPADSRVALFYGAANRDPAEFDDPEHLNFDRPHAKHLAFGMGIHRCVGSHYAVQELAIVIEQIVNRLRNLRLADPDAEIPYNYPRGRGPISLKVTFDPGPRLGKSA
jgi:cytochrome P450